MLFSFHFGETTFLFNDSACAGRVSVYLPGCLATTSVTGCSANHLSEPTPSERTPTRTGFPDITNCCDRDR